MGNHSTVAKEVTVHVGTGAKSVLLKYLQKGRSGGLWFDGRGRQGPDYAEFCRPFRGFCFLFQEDLTEGFKGMM